MVVGARARALAEPRRIPEAMRGVESAMACGFILLLQLSTRSFRARAMTLLWLLSCSRCSMGAAELNLRCRRLILFLPSSADGASVTSTL